MFLLIDYVQWFKLKKVNLKNKAIKCHTYGWVNGKSTIKLQI